MSDSPTAGAAGFGKGMNISRWALLHPALSRYLMVALAA